MQIVIEHFVVQSQIRNGAESVQDRSVIAPTEEDRKGAPAFTAAELASRPVVEEIACMEGKRNVMLTSVSALLHSHQADR